MAPAGVAFWGAFGFYNEWFDTIHLVSCGVIFLSEVHCGVQNEYEPCDISCPVLIDAMPDVSLLSCFM